ncbi:dipeptidase PepV [Lentilactobacillus laojiaonis]|uniref:dipeptidase PepV n=1 Tax=Lentilactobacillus laojiaonis TaxID=2883998 RepID=UPI001D0AADB2|nr:dipeptidase PepV [Lentilactobacillus laojiaonis]UDM32542.1 dipeptidase PepV [Lentilactobacillus laojiaonis]
MTNKWQDKANAYREDYLADLSELIAIESVRDVEHKTDEYPLGEGPTKAMEKFLSFGKRDGFTVKNIDNIVGYIEYGEGDQTLAIQSHADVMPAGNGWNTNPFELTIKDGIAYGRGTSDDKGPGLAAYYGLKMLKDSGVKPNLKIRLIVGTDEESNWTGMKHYFEVEPEPTFGFSPDAEFPVINGEKGNASFETTFGNSNGNNFALESFDSGLRENMVPGEATAVVISDNIQEIANNFSEFLNQSPVNGEVETDGKTAKLHVIGKQAHGMEPKNGINAGTYLASYLNQFNFGDAAADFLRFITKYLHDDSRANALGSNYVDDVMGDLTMNVGLMKFDQQNGGFINTNYRYPKGTTPDNILDKLQKAAQALNGKTVQISNMEPHYVDPTDPIVETLVNVYKEQTGIMDAKPEVVGGGTYARLMKRGVAFGALFPWTEDSMHQANEFQPVDDLLKAMAIYGQGIFELATK